MHTNVFKAWHLQCAQGGQATEHSLPKVADGVLSQVQALQEIQSYKSRLFQSGQMIEGQVSARNNSRQDGSNNELIFYSSHAHPPEAR